jgi:outer membrane protein
MKRLLSLSFLLALFSPAAPGRETPPPALHFTLQEAEQYALQNHPRIFSAQLTAEAVRQEIREARSAFFPQVYAELDAVYAPSNTRLAALNGLNNPSIYSRESNGVTINQLITDFGRTYDLTESAHFRAEASGDRLRVVEAVIVLEVDRAYFDVQRAQAVLQVAQETVKARQTSFDQISVLFKNQLRSSLDASFAKVDVDQANLLLVQAQNDEQQAEAVLSEAMGFPQTQQFALAPEPIDLSFPGEAQVLVFTAFSQRPELAELKANTEAARRFAEAQRAAQYPKITAMADGGVNPVYDSRGLQHDYYAAGVNVEVPLATGGNLDARAKEAELLTEADGKDAVDLQNTIARDVDIALLNLSTARKKMDIAADLTQAAGQALQLAQTRYQLGSSSIVEFTQAELNQTSALIQAASARYDFQIARRLLDFTIGGQPQLLPHPLLTLPLEEPDRGADAGKNR